MKSIKKKMLLLIVITILLLLVTSLSGCVENLPEPLIPIP